MSARPKARFATLMALTALVLSGFSICQVFNVDSNFDGTWGSLKETEIKSNAERIAELERQIAELRMPVGEFGIPVATQTPTEGVPVRTVLAGEEPTLEPATMKYIEEIESLLKKIKQEKSGSDVQAVQSGESNG